MSELSVQKVSGVVDINVSQPLSLSNSLVITANTSTNALTITQTGSGNALVVEDSANPDATPFVVDANGVVMIGTTTTYGGKLVSVFPGNNTNVTNYVFEGGSDTYRMVCLSEDTSNNSFVITNRYSSGGNIQFRTGTGGVISERVRIDPNGNVGIGTSLPNTRLHIEGSSGITTQVIKSTGSVAARINFQTTSDLNGFLNYDTGEWKIFSNSAGSPVERVRINTSGNVGIGTSSPGVKLVVYGASGTALSLNNSLTGVAAESGFQLQVGSSTDAYIWNYSNGPVVFGTNSAERARFDGSGRFLIGTTAAQSSYIVAASTSALDGMNVVADSTSGRGAHTFRNPNGVVGSIVLVGSSTVYNTSSDYRLKENIQPMQNALAKVSLLNPVTYTWKVDGSKGQGFIAHELQAVVPDCVTGEKDAVDDEGNPKYQGVDTSFLVATLTKAIQEQQAQIEALTARIEALESK